jgi:IS30 family transposase
MVGWLRVYSIQGILTWQSKLLLKYKHLSQAERYQIYALMKAGHDRTQIAKLLDRHKSTIIRELNLNTGSWGYRSKQAYELSTERAQNNRNAPTMSQELLVHGASIPQIMEVGGWSKTDTVMRSVERIHQLVS